MRKLRGFSTGLLLLGLLSGCRRGQNGDPAEVLRQIEDMYERHRIALSSKDIDALMGVYVPDERLVVFDAFSPGVLRKTSEYRAAYEAFFAAHPGPLTASMSEFHLTADGTVAFTSYLNRIVTTQADGKPTEIVFRVSNGLKRFKDTWRIVHEHTSVPIDPASGKAAFLNAETR